MSLTAWSPCAAPPRPTTSATASPRSSPGQAGAGAPGVAYRRPRGVQAVEARIVELAILDVEGFEPVIGMLASIPEHGEPQLNRLALRQGRFVAPGRPDEVVISEPSPKATTWPGDHLHAIINDLARLDVVGVALSPEYVYSIGPALMPDDQRFGVLWMGERPGRGLRPGRRLQRPGAVPAAQRGGGGRHRPPGPAAGALWRHRRLRRKDQVSNWFVERDGPAEEPGNDPADHLPLGGGLPSNMVAQSPDRDRAQRDRLVQAFGYSSLEIGWHYMSWSWPSPASAS